MKKPKGETEKPVIDIPLEEFVAKGQAAQADIDTYLIDAEIEKANQRVLDNIETADAQTLLRQLSELERRHSSELNTDEALAIVKRWLKKHWSDGWRAAGGSSGAPEPTRKRKDTTHEM